jgi:hypothetical protein
VPQIMRNCISRFHRSQICALAWLCSFWSPYFSMWPSNERHVPEPRSYQPDQKSSSRKKKLVAVGLTLLLLSMAAYNLGIVTVHTYRSLMAGHRITPEPNAFFYNDVFTEALILILSLVVSGRYEMVFRNAAFVLSIILLCFSLTEDHPHGAPLGLIAIMFGILTLLVFNFHSRIYARD